jgi:hypothetical protein
MATIREKIAARMLAWSPLTALVGSRIVPDEEQSENPDLPYVTFYRVGKISEQGFGSSLGIATAQWQINCYGQSRAQTEAVADQVEAAFNRWSDPSELEIFTTVPVRLGEALVQVESPNAATTSYRQDLVEVTIYHRE